MVPPRSVNAAINILLKARSESLSESKTREGHSQSNAQGVETSTLFGATLIEQVLTMNLESPSRI